MKTISPTAPSYNDFGAGYRPEEIHHRHSCRDFKTPSKLSTEEAFKYLQRVLQGR